jgi:hypothetical protein
MKRIQRKRVKGWRMPPNTVYVGRPTKWGNPYKMTRIIDPDSCSREEAIRKYKDWLSQKLSNDPHFLDPLKNKDLACWCRLDKPCHADILLEFLGRKAE